MNKDQIISYLHNDHNELVNIKNQAPGKTVLKYKNKVFYKNLWTPELCEFRGTVVDDAFNIVQRPFTKIFNSHESFAPTIALNSPVTGVEKVNGFMAAASIINDELFVSTTGSIESDYVLLAHKHISKLHWEWFDDNMTYIFEICDDTDPHIVPQDAGAYLLGARYKTWESPQHAMSEYNLDILAGFVGCMRPKHFRFETYNQLLKTVKYVTHEGFVVWDDEGNELKIKSPYYLTTKFFGRKNEKKLEAILTDPAWAKTVIDEEYYPVIDYLNEHKADFIEMTEQEKMKFLRDYFDKAVLYRED